MGNYKIFDLESNEYCEVSQKAYEAYKRWMDKLMSNIKLDKTVGSVIITSSCADENNGEEFKKLFQ